MSLSLVTAWLPTCVFADGRTVIAGASEINVLHRRPQGWVLSCTQQLPSAIARILGCTDGHMQQIIVAPSGVLIQRWVLSCTNSYHQHSQNIYSYDRNMQQASDAASGAFSLCWYHD